MLKKVKLNLVQIGPTAGFCSMKPTRSIATPPGWDASPTPSYLSHVAVTVSLYSFILLGGERHCESHVSCPSRRQNNPALNLNHSIRSPLNTVTIKPPRFSHCVMIPYVIHFILLISWRQGGELIDFLQNKYLPTLHLAPGLIQVNTLPICSLNCMIRVDMQATTTTTTVSKYILSLRKL